MKESLRATRILVVIACAFAFFSAFAYTERNLLKKHATFREMRESLVLDQKWVPYPDYSDRDGWDKLMGDTKDNYIKRGENVLNYEWQIIPATSYLAFERTGDRTEMEKIYNANFYAVAALVMAELAEGKGRFIDKIIDGVYVGAESLSWALSAHTAWMNPDKRVLPKHDFTVMDIFSSGVSQAYAWIYYFFKDEFDKIDPEISRRLFYELKTRVMDPYIQNNDTWWMARRFDKDKDNLSNWVPWSIDGPLLTFMLCENDRKKLAWAVWLTMETIDKYMNFLGGDGACEEGALYWGVAAGKLVDVLESLKEITGGKIDLFAEPLIKDIGEFVSRSYIGDGWIVNFSDANSKSGGGDSYLAYRIGKLTGSDELKGYAAHIASNKNTNGTFPISFNGCDIAKNLRCLVIRDEFRNYKPEIMRVPLTWYPVNEIAYFTTPGGLYVAAKGGNNGVSHSHNDAGTCIVSYNNTPFLIDPGRATYTRQYFDDNRYSFWNTRSSWHNTPTINGVEQMNGAEYKATNCKADKKTFSADIAQAYPQEAKVKSWIRSYTVGDKDIRITDNYELSASVAPNEINFITWGDVDASVPGKVLIKINGQTASLGYDASRFTLLAEDNVFEDPAFKGDWGDKITRLRFIEKNKSLKGNHSFTFRGL